ncbi:hypothetical protein Tco_0957980 [Tanacetum coccineum]
MELHVVSYGIDSVARPLLLFFSSENQLLWFRYREYDSAHLKLVFEFSIYIVWKSVRYDVSNGLDTAYWGFLGVGITLDIFQNLHILCLQYGVLGVFRYGVLSLFPSWSLTLFDVIGKIFDFGGLTGLMAKGLSGRMLIEHRDAQGQGVFTSRAWRRLFEIRGPLLGKVRRRMSWREFILGMGLHTAEEIESVGFGAYWVESARQIPDKRDLSAYWREISSAGDFFGTTPSQAPDKVIVTDLFYLRGMDDGSINIPYLLARMLTEERLQGLTMIVRDLPEIDMAELICEELDDTEGAPDVVEGGQSIPAPVQAPQPPPAARTISQRLARLEEDVHRIQVSLGEQREVVNVMAKDFSIFTVWAAGGISQLLDSAGATCIRYSETHVPYQRRRVRQRTDGASTATA